MGDASLSQVGLPVTVWTGGVYGCAGPGTRAVLAGGTNLATTAWGTANLAIYSPVAIPFRYPVRNLFVYNFATVAGNVDIGIYNSDGVRLVSSGSTAMAGASTLQFFTVDLVLEPGAYFIGFVSSSTTATFATMGFGTASRERYLGLLQQATALPLPAAMTAATVGQARIPGVGFTYVSGTPSF